MSDWESGSEEDTGGDAGAVAGRVWQPPASPPQNCASIESSGERRSTEWRREAAVAGPGREEWEPRGAEGSRGLREAARQRPPRAAAGQTRDAGAPLRFHLDNALVGALIGNNGRTPTHGCLAR